MLKKKFWKFLIAMRKEEEREESKRCPSFEIVRGIESFLMLCGRNFGNFWLRRMVKKHKEGGLKGFGIVRVIFNVGCKKFLDKKDGKEIIRKIE